MELNIKHFLDPVHGSIEIPKEYIKIIDHPLYQRLRYIKQLGLVNYVYPSATHTRFEHSLGVCHLSLIMIKSIRDKQPELKINNSLINCIGIAGLIHDLGHGPLSHAFDDHILRIKEIKQTFQYPDTHEERTKVLFDEIIKDTKLKLTENEKELIKDLVNPPLNKKDIWYYQIVCNNLNGIDIDKIDYIHRDSYHIGIHYKCNVFRILSQCRVIDNIICYPEKTKFEIYDLFQKRYSLFKQVYTHAVVRGIELLVKQECEKKYMIEKISKLKFIDMVDYELLIPALKKREILKYDNEIIKECNEINNNEDSSKMIDQFSISMLSTNDANSDPINNIYFFKSKNNNKKYNISRNEISMFMTNNNTHEYYTRFYSKRKKENNLVTL